jgi:lipoyl synthase
MSVEPGERRLLRIEARNATTPIEKKPAWIKTRLRTGPEFTELKELVRREGLHTVCEEAGCPNIFECWEDREATFLIGGDACTRRCDFCQIDTGKPAPLDRDEPRRVATSVQAMGLRYATVTGVARDDLPDEGAWLYAETVRQIHELNQATGVEILTPDFSAKPELLQQVFDAAPEVFAHNVETVPRIFKRIRPAFRYERSLDVLRLARADGMVTKSNLILGMGETRGSRRDRARRRDERATGPFVVPSGPSLPASPRCARIHTDRLKRSRTFTPAQHNGHLSPSLCSMWQQNFLARRARHLSEPRAASSSRCGRTVASEAPAAMHGRPWSPTTAERGTAPRRKPS